jgi:hypothetical protein
MHKILVYLHIIHLLNSSTCFEHYPAHLQEVYVVTAYMQPLVSSLSAGDCLVHWCCYAALHIVSFVHGCFMGKCILTGSTEQRYFKVDGRMEKKVGYCYPSRLEKTLCKWDTHVPLVTKGLMCNMVF